jgi:hypothetical protein
VRYQAAITLSAQVEITTVGQLQMSGGGNVPDYRTAFVLHFRELEQKGLVDTTTGKPLIQPGAIIDSIKTSTGAIERLYDDPPVHVTESREIGHGFGGRRNLLLLITDDRPQGLAETPR